MESLKIVKAIDYLKDYEKEKEYIIQTYLNNTIFDNDKKKIIEQYIDFADLRFNILRGLNEEEYKFTSRTNQYLLRYFKKNINDVIDFNDTPLLNDLLHCFNSYYKQEYKNFYYFTYFLKASFECYSHLKFFIDSHIDESNYDKTINSLQKKATQLQQFSSKTIKLDKIPYHPADIILEFSSELKVVKNDHLFFINLILEALNYNRFRGEYKTLPHPSKKTRERIKENTRKFKPIFDAIMLSWETKKE